MIRMGLSAHLYVISPEAFEAGKAGDFENLVWREDLPDADLDKAWHAIHFLVTGDAEPNFLLSGVQVPRISDHFEVHSPKDVAALNDGLSKMPVADLMTGYDAKAFNALKIYNGPWDDAGASHVEKRLREFLSVLKLAAESGCGLAVVMT